MTKLTFKSSVLCAVRGLFKGISSERNIKIQILISAIIIFIALLLEISRGYLITIIIVCFLIIILELFNRGFEKLIDLISPEYNKEFGRVKDIMAGVVLLTFIMAAVVSFLILYAPVMNLLLEFSKNIPALIVIAANIIVLLAVLFAARIKNKN